MQLWASGVAGRADGRGRLRSYANQVKCRQCGDLSRLHLLAGVNVVFADKCERGTSHLFHSTEKAVQRTKTCARSCMAFVATPEMAFGLLIQLPTCPALPSPPSLSYNQCGYCGLILNAVMIAEVFSLYCLVKTTQGQNVVFIVFKDPNLVFIHPKIIRKAP